MYFPVLDMSVIEGLIIFCSILLLYAAVVIVLRHFTVLEKYNISFWGPALMWRTNKGKKFLSTVATKKRFWKAFGSSGIVLCFIMMILMTSVLIMQAWVVFGFTAEQKEALPGPEMALILPGINPILPLEFIGYVILALVVAMVVHEFSHGIMTLAHNLKVKSLGILYLIVPIGAFCEPDEEELKKTSIPSRMRVYASGPTSNFVVVVVSVLLFSFILMSAVQPAADGVSVMYVGSDTPAQSVGLTQGMIITSLNDTSISSMDDFFEVMQHTKSNQSISISYVKGKQTFNTQVILDDKSNYSKNQSHAGEGYLGMSPSNNHEVFLSVLKNPHRNFPDNFLVFYILPLWGYLQGYNPIVAPFTDSYQIVGPLAVIPSSVFWMIVNAVYWIFWLNLAVALFNVLPMIPLDGGFLFNDGMKALVQKLKKESSEEQQEKTVKNISLVLSLLILFLVVFPFFIKYIP
jgi:membrane-associated protease RseP (regulator of RpoE activity)